MPQVLLNVRLPEGVDWTRAGSPEQERGEVEKLLGQDGRLLIRASGTEPVLRVMVEARDGEMGAGVRRTARRGDALAKDACASGALQERFSTSVSSWRSLGRRTRAVILHPGGGAAGVAASVSMRAVPQPDAASASGRASTRQPPCNSSAAT